MLREIMGGAEGHSEGVQNPTTSREVTPTQSFHFENKTNKQNRKTTRRQIWFGQIIVVHYNRVLWHKYFKLLYLSQ